ncbi:MAG: hypothetical protein J5843_03435 [Clostridia bacterium]|nr:hypothetical protein [Clostridia bacterium]
METEKNELLDGIADSFDFEGEVYTFSVPQPDDYGLIWYYREEMNGDVLNDAIYTRNSTVEERFNVAIDARMDGWSPSQFEALSPLIMSGDDSVDLIGLTYQQSGTAVIGAGLTRHWNDVPYIDLEKPYWDSNFNDMFNVRGKHLLISGDYNWTCRRFSTVLYFNKHVAENYAVPDLYQTVLEGRWTLDLMHATAADISSDLNGDGAWDENDQYGLIQNLIGSLHGYQISTDNIQAEMTDDGPVQNLVTDKIVSVSEKLKDMIWNDHTTYAEGFDWAKDSLGIPIFFGDRALFLCAYLKYAEEFRELEGSYGIIPLPKYDETQKNYQTQRDQWGLSLAIPKSVSDITFIGVITEALCSSTALHVIDAYYDVVLPGKELRDEESIEMMQIIFDNIVYDWGICAGQGILSPVVRDNLDFSSYAKKNEKIFLKGLKKWYEAAQ